MKVLVEIDPLKPKKLYDVTVERNVDDLQWWGRGVKKITVTFTGGGKNNDVTEINNRITGTSNLPTISKSAHSALSAGKLTLKYKLDVDYPAGTLHVDPVVIIEP